MPLMYKAWREFAELNGWAFQIGYSGYPSISGEYRGRQFKFDDLAYTKFFMKRPRRKIIFSIFNPTDVKVNLRGGMFISFVNLFLSSGLHLGEESFDQQFVVKGEPKELVQELLESGIIRRELKEIQALVGGVSIKVLRQNLICEWSLLSGLSKTNVMKIFDTLSDLADTIDKM